MKTYSFYSIIVTLITLLASSCNETSITDLPESYNFHKKIKPNEDYISSRHTYGKDSICGNEISYLRTTNNSNVYIDLNLTLLELHPKITTNLLSFIHYELYNRGFIVEPDTIPPFDIHELITNGYTQCEIARKILDWECELFDDSLCRFERGYWLEIYITPIFLNENYVTYGKYSETYLSGAHPNYSSFKQTYDLTTGKTINLEDIIKPDKYDQLREKVVGHMANTYPFNSEATSVDKYLDDLNEWIFGTSLDVHMGFEQKDDFYNKITLENFPLNDPGIHECGLVFSYEKYHLTPGYVGCPYIVVSYDEIRDCLKAPFNDYVTMYSSHAIESTENDCEFGCKYSDEDKDSIRKTMGLSDNGNPFPIEAYDEYVYRHGKPLENYQTEQLYGTWIGYGHLYDPRHILTLNPNGSYIDIIENADRLNINKEIEYVFTSKIIGKYIYDKGFNKLTLLNTKHEYEIPTENYLIYNNPEHSKYIIHSIENDTLILADETGDLWPYYRYIESN